MALKNYVASRNLYILLVICLKFTLSYGQKFNFTCPEDSNPYYYPCTCEGGDEEGLIIKCENANLASISQGLSNIRLPISHLHIQKCNFYKLFGGVFGSILLQRLYIDNVPIRSIEKSVFEGVSETLKEFHIQGAELTNGIPKQALDGLKKLQVLNIQGANIGSLLKNSLPNLPDLRRLFLQHCNISSINKDAFTQLRKLERLYLSHNHLSDLPKRVFQRQRDIKVLDLAFNNFTAMDTSYFQDLRQLTWCNMSHNAIKSFGNSPFARNTVLGWLSLTHNLITEVPSNTFRTLRALRRLYLSDNKISKVGRSAFSNMRRIGTLDLSRNNLTAIDTQMFQDFQYCEHINVASFVNFFSYFNIHGSINYLMQHPDGKSLL